MTKEKRITDETTKGGPKRSSLEAENDHWKFLEEMDAPMWADLEAEAQGPQQDSDAAWFQVIHPFHQRSSNQILSYFHLSGARNEDKLDCFSPKLPDSVSKSRGKHYNQKSWKEAIDVKFRIQRFSPDRELFQHPIKALRSKNSSSSSNTSNSHSTPSRGFTRKTPSRGFKRSSVALKTTRNSQADYVDKSCEKRVASRMSQSFPKRSGLLSAVRISLRRSFLTGHASRVKIKEDAPLKGRKSSTTKSSIASTVTIGGTSGGANSMTMSRKGRTPQSRHVSSVSSTSNGTRKVLKILVTSKTGISNLNLCSKRVLGTVRSSKMMDSRKPLQLLNAKTVFPKDRDTMNPKSGTCTRKSQVATSFNTEKENAPKILSQSKKDPICSVQLKNWRGQTAVKGKINMGPHVVQGKHLKASATPNVHLR